MKITKILLKQQQQQETNKQTKQNTMLMRQFWEYCQHFWERLLNF